MNCLDIICKYLSKNGFDGLCNHDAECGCGLKDIAPCSSDVSFCEPAYDHGPRAGYDNYYSTVRPKKTVKKGIDSTSDDR